MRRYNRKWFQGSDSNLNPDYDEESSEEPDIHCYSWSGGYDATFSRCSFGDDSLSGSPNRWVAVSYSCGISPASVSYSDRILSERDQG